MREQPDSQKRLIGELCALHSLIAQDLFSAKNSSTNMPDFLIFDSKTEDSNITEMVDYTLKRQQALELVYAMATAFGTSLQSLNDQIILNINDVLQISFAAIGRIDGRYIKEFSVLSNSRISHSYDKEVEGHLLQPPITEKKNVTIHGDLSEHFSDDVCRAYSSYLGVPMVHRGGGICGVIVIMDKDNRQFTQHEIHLVEIFARYYSHEVEREILTLQLRQSQEMRMLGQLASGVAHEVRNPLNAIVALTEAMHQELGHYQEFYEYLTHIKSQVNRLTILMSDLLELGRPVETRHMHPFNLLDVLQDGVGSWKLASRHGGRKIVTDYARCPPQSRILGDPYRLHQVIFNLLENACNHSAADKEIKIEVAQNSHDQIRISVIDKGCGVDKSHLKSLFEPFFTTRRGGTGLGLGIVKRIVESHNGTVTLINNMPPPGARVDINLPLLIS
ncbi:MAG: ATP-binding protein [Chitinispirillaceae bacterium]